MKDITSDSSESMDLQSKLERHYDIENTAQSRDRLTTYREAVGISDVVQVVHHAGKKRKSNNIGIYNRICREESKARWQFYAVSFVINACLLLQLVFGAALTALGASASSHVVITAFGVANTVIAGILSFMKGQGLPSKLRQYQHVLRKVREYIEQRERDFGFLDCPLDVHKEIRTVIALYESARQNDEDNDTDNYTSPTAPPAPGKAVSFKESERPTSVDAKKPVPPAEYSRPYASVPLEEEQTGDETKAQPSNVRAFTAHSNWT